MNKDYKSENSFEEEEKEPIEIGSPDKVINVDIARHTANKIMLTEEEHPSEGLSEALSERRQQSHRLQLSYQHEMKFKEQTSKGRREESEDLTKEYNISDYSKGDDIKKVSEFIRNDNYNQLAGIQNNTSPE